MNTYSVKHSANVAAELISGDTVLSKSGDLAVSTEAQEFVCYLHDGRFLVAEGQQNNPLVVSYRFRLARMGKPIQLIETDLATIRRHYTTGQSNEVDHTAMQCEAKALLADGAKAGASDVHIRVQKYSTEVHFRVNSDLRKCHEFTREYGERLLATLYGAMADVSDSAYKPTERQDARIGDVSKLPESLHGVRIATAPTVEGYLMVMRLLYASTAGSTDLEKLGFLPEQRKLIEAMSDQPIGMNIISGPTGSGKSTTLQRVLTRQIDCTEGKTHIITVEDPPEYPIEGAVQTPVANASTAEMRAQVFTAAISNAMRLDPDTIMVGEVRDGASAHMVLKAAMTGHQVWTTVHANNAIAVIDRLIDLGLPINMVADHFVVSGLQSQRLAKMVCPHCSIPLSDAQGRARVHPDTLARLTHALDDDLQNARSVGDGCSHCGGRAIVGRTVVAEVLRPDARFYDFIRAGEKLRARDYWLRELGGINMTQHMLKKIQAGIVDPVMAEGAIGHLYNPLK
jgi:general secretion pathway protein E